MLVPSCGVGVFGGIWGRLEGVVGGNIGLGGRVAVYNCQFSVPFAMPAVKSTRKIVVSSEMHLNALVIVI